MGIAIAFYAAVVLASLIRPLWGLIGLTLSILIRFQDRFPPLENLPVFQLVTAAILVGMLLNPGQLARPNLKQDKIIAYFVGFVALGLLLMARGELVSQFMNLLSSVLIYFFVTRLVKTRKDLVTLLVLLTIGTLGLGIEAMRSFYLDPQTPFANTVTGRLQGIGYYANANEFGKLMCTAIPFAAIFVFRGSIIVRLLALGAIACMVLVIGLTLSRTCFVVLVLMVGSAIMLRSGGRIIYKGIMLVIAGFALLTALTYLPGPLQERAQSILEYSEDTSFQGRVRAWEQGFQMVSWYPVFGVGKGQWTKYHGRAPHNSYVQVMAETGLPGVAMFFAVIWLSFSRIANYLSDVARDKRKELSIVGLAIGASFLGYLFYILLGNQGYSPWTYFYFGLCGAFTHLVHLERGSGTTDSKVPVSKRRQRRLAAASS